MHLSAVFPCTTPSTSPTPQGLGEELEAEIDLTRAYIQSAAMGSVTPLLKQELRYKIRARRLLEGKAEIPVTHVQVRPVFKVGIMTLSKLC